MAKRLNKNDIIRGRIFDDIASQFSNSVLGMYDGKLRIEIIDDETGEVIQFSLAPVVHKSLVEEADCEKYISIDDRIAEYQSELKKNETKSKKKKKEKVKDIEPTKEETTIKPKEVIESISLKEQEELDNLMKAIGGFEF